MVSHCANPNCGARLRYLREGRVFATVRENSATGERTMEHFWLCGRCFAEFSVRFDHSGSPKVIERSTTGTRRPAARRSIA